MSRPKGSTNKAKTEQGTADATSVEEKPTEVKATETVVTDVVIEAPEPLPLKKGDLFLMIVNGKEDYWTKGQVNIMLQRNTHDIEIPKGSPFVAPANSKCKGCG